MTCNLNCFENFATHNEKQLFKTANENKLSKTIYDCLLDQLKTSLPVTDLFRQIFVCIRSCVVNILSMLLRSVLSSEQITDKIQEIMIAE